MTMKINSKLPNTGITIFTTMSKMAVEHNAINLSQGFPEFEVDPILVDLVERNIKEQKNQYAPMQGVEVLREQIAIKTLECYQCKIDQDSEITVTSGATEALFVALTSVIEPGDEVILFEPAYDSYEPVIRLNGGIPVYIQLEFPNYQVDWQKVKDAITKKTKMIVINSPHNPTGSVLKQKDLSSLRELLAGTEIFITSDEVYEHIVFDGLQHESILRYPELAARSFVISSFGKTFHTTGWKTGYCIAPPELTKEFRRIHQYVTFASNTPIQYAYAEYLTMKEKYLDLPAFYQRKRDVFAESVKGSRFKLLKCEGTYFQMLDYSEISDQSDLDFSAWLTKEKGIASIPPSVFYHEKLDKKVLRFCFAKNDETLQAAGEVLKAI